MDIGEPCRTYQSRTLKLVSHLNGTIFLQRSDADCEPWFSVYITSILVSFYALFVCSESDEDPSIPASDPIQWLRVAKGTRFICARWEELVGPAWIASSGVFYG